MLMLSTYPAVVVWVPCEGVSDENFPLAGPFMTPSNPDFSNHPYHPLSPGLSLSCLAISSPLDLENVGIRNVILHQTVPGVQACGIWLVAVGE